jgi:hypothetical protein
MIILLQLLILHFFGDYVFQNDFVASRKHQDRWINLAHCTIYAGTISLAFINTDLWLTSFLLALLSHSWDFFKRLFTPNFRDSQLLDQSIHIVLLIVLFGFLIF